MNVKEHDQAQFFLECKCCFDDEVTWDQAVCCRANGHIVCRSCVDKFVDNLVTNQLGVQVGNRH